MSEPTKPRNEREKERLKSLKLRTAFELVVWLPLGVLSILDGDWGILLFIGVAWIMVFRNYITETLVVKYRTLLDDVFETINKIDEENSKAQVAANKPAKKPVKAKA